MTRNKEYLPSSVTAVFTGDLGGIGPSESNDLLARFVASVATRSAAAGAGMIGHVKANFKSGDQMLSVSTTSLEGKTSLKSKFDDNVWIFEGAMNAHVFGITHSQVAMAISDAARDAGVFTDISLKAETGCNDPACVDPDCAEHNPRPLVPE